MKPRLIDSHCHLHFPAYETDREIVITHMRERGVWGITVGTNVATSKAGIAFAEQHPDVFATIGYHPEHLTSSYIDPKEPRDDKPYAIESIAELIGSKKVVAIGETGLDFFRIDADRDPAQAKQIQESALRDHIALADQNDLPLVIHCRDAFGRLAEVIREEQSSGKKVRGVIHCFTGTWEEGKALLDLGFYLSFTGIITFPPKKDEDPEKSTHRTIERMPLDRMLVETDAPWLTPLPYRGKRNEPAYVEHVAAKIAELRRVTTEEISEKTVQNTVQLFRLPV